MIKNTLYLEPDILKVLSTVIVSLSAKYLGVDISKDLTSDACIRRSIKKLNQALGLLCRNIKVKYEFVESIAYKTLVRPQVGYGPEV